MIRINEPTHLHVRVEFGFLLVVCTKYVRRRQMAGYYYARQLMCTSFMHVMYVSTRSWNALPRANTGLV